MPSSAQNISMQEFLQGQQSNSPVHKDQEESPEPTDQQPDGISVDPQEKEEDKGPKPAFSIHDFFWYKMVICNRTHVMQSYDIKFSDPNMPIKRVNAEYITPEVIESFWKDIKEKTTAADERANSEESYVATPHEIHDRACLRKRQELEASGYKLTTGFVGAPKTNNDFTVLQRDVFGEVHVTPGKIRPDPKNDRVPTDYVNGEAMDDEDYSDEEYPMDSMEEEVDERHGEYEEVRMEDNVEDIDMVDHQNVEQVVDEQVNEERVAAQRQYDRRAFARRIDARRADDERVDAHRDYDYGQRFYDRLPVARPADIEEVVAELQVAAAARVVPDEQNPGGHAAER